MGAQELGRGGRLTGGPAPELVEAGYAYETGHGPRLARGLSLADLAHAVALVEGGGLRRRRTPRRSAGACSSCTRSRPSEFPWDPQLGDAFNSPRGRARAARRAATPPAG